MKLPPIVFAFAFAAVIAWRWRRLGWSGQARGRRDVCRAGAAWRRRLCLPELETVIGDLGSALGPARDALVAVMALLETGAFVGPLVPGETVVIAGGVVASQGHIDLVAVVGLTWICAFAGDVTGYAGPPARRRFLLEHGPRVHMTGAQSDPGGGVLRPLRPRDDPNRKFVGPGPAIAPFLARRVSRYPARRFGALALAGTGLWGTASVLLGFAFWQSLDEAVAIAQRSSLAGRAPPRGRLPPAARPGGSTDRPITAQLQRDRC